MFNKFLNLSLAKKSALITASICFFTSIILILASYQSNRQIIAQSTEMLGENLAQQLARDASNALVQGDKLSLQSLLNNLVSSSPIVYSVIYDVENQPIAEAGKKPRNIASKAFSASITFQDSLAGYAVIDVNPQVLNQSAQSSLWQLFILVFLLACLAYIVGLAPARYLAASINDLTMVARKSIGERPTNIQIAYRGRDEFQRLARQVIAGPDKTENAIPQTDNNLLPTGEHAVLYLEINNLKALKEQRNQQKVKALVDQCHQQLTTICKLYKGELSISSSSGFSVTFFPNNEQDYPFRALCSGFLMSHQFSTTKAAGAKNPLQLRLRVELCQKNTLNSEEDPLGFQLHIQQTIETTRQLTKEISAEEYNSRLIAGTSLLEHPSVFNKVVINIIDDHSAVIESLQSSYKLLLDKQLQTLRSQL